MPPSPDSDTSRSKHIPTVQETVDDLTEFGHMAGDIFNPRLNTLEDRLRADPSKPLSSRDMGLLNWLSKQLRVNPHVGPANRAGIRGDIRAILKLRLDYIRKHESGEGAPELPPCDMGALRLYGEICIAAHKEATKRRDEEEADDSTTPPATLSPNEPHPGEPPLTPKLAKRFMIRGNPGFRVIVDWDRCAYLRTISNKPADEKQRLLDAWEAEHGTYESLVVNR